MEWYTMVLYLLGAVAVFSIFVIIYNATSQKQTHQLATDVLLETQERVEGFTAKARFAGVDSSYLFAIDTVSNRIVYVKYDVQKIVRETSLRDLEMKLDPIVVNIDDVMSVEIEEDGRQIYARSAIGTLGGATLGNEIAGKPGMLLGGVLGQGKQKEMVSKLEVKLRLRNPLHPVVVINCLDVQQIAGTKEIDKDGVFIKKYRKAKKHSEKIRDYLENFLKAYEVAYTYRQLWDLQTDGDATEMRRNNLEVLKKENIITEAEYQQLQAKLFPTSTR